MAEHYSLFLDAFHMPYGFYSSSYYRHRAYNNVNFIQRLHLETKLHAHNGCVNTICWNDSGTCILSGSDDQKLCISDPYSGKVVTSIQSGHRANIFSAKFMPNTKDRQIVSCSGDGLIYYTDVEKDEAFGTSGFDCHFGTTYEVLTVPQDPHSFLSCGEDGTVRWFDLRIKTSCTKEDCKEDVLINCRRAVTAIATNPVAPYQLGVGCSDSSIRIFDRRMLGTKATGNYTGRGVQGMISRFSAPGLENRYHRITCINYSPDGEEMLVSYSSEYIYLFNLKENGRLSKHFSADGTRQENTPRERVSISSRRQPPIKRLRLRGDWSDTGPSARPESERQGEGQPVDHAAATIMQRMSDMLTRWLEGTTRRGAEHEPPPDRTSPGTPANRSAAVDVDINMPPGDAASSSTTDEDRHLRQVAEATAGNPETNEELESQGHHETASELTVKSALLTDSGNPESSGHSNNHEELDSTKKQSEDETIQGQRSSLSNTADGVDDGSESNSLVEISSGSLRSENKRTDEREGMNLKSGLESASVTQSSNESSQNRGAQCELQQVGDIAACEQTVSKTEDLQLSSHQFLPESPQQSLALSEGTDDVSSVDQRNLSELPNLPEAAASAVERLCNNSDLLSVSQTVKSSVVEPILSLQYRSEGTCASTIRIDCRVRHSPDLGPVSTTEEAVNSGSEASQQRRTESLESQQLIVTDPFQTPESSNIADRLSDSAVADLSMATTNTSMASANMSVAGSHLSDSELETCECKGAESDKSFKRPYLSSTSDSDCVDLSAKRGSESEMDVGFESDQEAVHEGNEMSVIGKNNVTSVIDEKGQSDPTDLVNNISAPSDIDNTAKNDATGLTVAPEEVHANSVQLPGEDLEEGRTEREKPETSTGDQADAGPSGMRTRQRKIGVSGPPGPTTGGTSSPDGSEEDDDSDSERMRAAGPGRANRWSPRLAEDSSADRNAAARKLQELYRKRQEMREREEADMMQLPQPQMKMVYKGHRNARTMIKESCFWGDGYVMSGSDCGHVFVWDRYTAKLVMLLEGDKHVVNCLQPHPYDPILATSGIDYDIKIWTPTGIQEHFDAERADEILMRNEVMLEETRDTITVPASFMLRMLASLNHFRNVRRGAGGGENDSSSDDDDDDH